MTRDKKKTKIVIKVFRYDRSILRSHKREQTYLLRLPPVARVSNLSGSRVKVIPGAVARPRPEACARPQGRRYIGVVGTEGGAGLGARPTWPAPLATGSVVAASRAGSGTRENNKFRYSSHC